MVQILLLDDSKFACNRTKEMFESIEFGEPIELIIASDEQGFRQCLQNYPNLDIALVDYNMPFMNGLEAIDVIRKQLPHCQLVLLTATSAFITGSKEVPSDVSLIQKPASIEKLQSVLTHFEKKAG